MSAVSQIRMQAAASRLNSGNAQSGSKPDAAAAPAGFEGFLAALDQSSKNRLAARAAPDKNSGQVSSFSMKGMQNLPTRGAQSDESANTADPMQLLMGQLVAQSMMTQALANPNQTAAASPVDASVAPAATEMQQLINALGAQSLDSKQTALITQALSKAIKASGQEAESGAPGQAAQLLQAFQNQLQAQIGTGSALNQASDQAKAQLDAQAALAIQTLAQKNGVTLSPEVQAKLKALAGQSDASSIKLLSLEAGAQAQAQAQAKTTPVVVSTQAGKVDPTKAATIDTLTDPKNQKVLGATPAMQDKVPKLKTLEGNLNALGLGDKSPTGRSVDFTLGAQDGKTVIGKVAGTEVEGTNISTVTEGVSHFPLPNIDPTFNPNQAGLARLDPGVAAQHKVEIKASDVSLVDGPLHAEILNSAKTGGGRIMFELTPPEQGTIRIDLRISSSGQAHLIVEGASEAAKSRLDQGSQNLKNDFAQMGLNLSLDLRQGAQSQQMRDQAFGGNRQGSYAGPTTGISRQNSSVSISSISSGDNKGNKSTVHLYA